ncbi:MULTISPECIES: glycosyltransferase family 4 protein [Streptomyces]|uniref:glycosyltransferase family 4 protein n=1 Tax=Streptomyces TaxID=1883 RepID=UPI00099EB0BD|nr:MULTISPECIES: glycosyltransferase family 4 protein [Streptomyces]
MMKSLDVAGEFYVHDGYAGISEYIVLGLSRLGVRVNLVPFKLETDGLSAEMLDIVAASGPIGTGPLLFNSWVRPELARYSGRPHMIHTMWESSRLPASWVEPLNRARVLMVPTRFVARMFRDSGITVPIEVAPDGVDADVYPYVARPARETFTTLVVGTVVPRKHVAQAVEAWRLAFADEPGARLVVKARFGAEGRGGLTSRDPRVTIVDANEPTRGILHWYEQADVLLALGSEGFGLPLVEGMATGLPVIALSSEGQGDVCADAGDLVLPVSPSHWEDVYEPHLGHCGVRGVPDVAEVARHLRWVAAHRDEARSLGRAASDWAHKERDVWQKPKVMLDVMEHHWPE